MKTKLEQAFDCVVKIYHQYCILDPVDDYLHPKEFCKLMLEQAPHFMKNTTPPHLDQKAYCKYLFQLADKDRNGYLKFTEFMCPFGAVLNECHERSHVFDDEHKTPGHGHSH